MTAEQAKNAMRVANVPAESIEAQIESDNPPTLPRNATGHDQAPEHHHDHKNAVAGKGGGKERARKRDRTGQAGKPSSVEQSRACGEPVEQVGGLWSETKALVQT